MSLALRRRRTIAARSNPFADYTLEGNAPTLVMDTEAAKYGLDGVSKAIAEVVTFTRASTATYVNSSGVLTSAAIDEIRIDHDPATLAVRGMLVEPAATNLLLNTATLSTQDVTVTAVEHTLHFTGTGTVTLSGASTAGPLVGTGAGESNRVSLTFTPTAGTLTCTVSGSVEVAQLEVGTQSSYYPSTGTQGTRAKDVPSTLLSAFSFSATVGTVLVEFSTYNRVAGVAYRIGGGTGYNWLYTLGVGAATSNVFHDGSSNIAILAGASMVSGVAQRYATAFQTDDYAMSNDGGAVVTDSLGNLFTGATAIGYGATEGGATQLGGHIKKLIYYPARLSNSALEAWSGE